MFHTHIRKDAWLAIVTIVAVASFSIRSSAQEPNATMLLEKMSAHMAELDAFIITGDGYVDARLDAGQIIEHASEVTMRVRKPGSMRMTNRTSEGTKNLYFSKGILSLYSETENFYAQAEVPVSIEGAAIYAIEEIGIDAPLLDFVSSDMAANIQADAEDVQHMGQSLIRGAIYEHIAIRTPEIDIQLWIASEGPPLPGKMSISSKWEGGAPRFVVFLSWDTDPSFPEGSLDFVPPPTATKIEFVKPANQ